MNQFSLLSLAAIAALASEPVAIQKITVEASVDSKSVEADEMVKFSRQSDLGEMLSNTLPEITHVRNSAVGNDIILRGFRKDNLVITIDDAKVCGACPNTMDPPSMHLSSAQIASVEVQEGPFDVTQFGSLGGKINVATKDPKKGLHGEVSATLGSFKYRKLSTTVEGGNDTVQALVGFSRETSGQYKDGEGRTLTEQTDHLLPSAPAPHAQEYQSSYANADAYDRNNFWTKIVGNVSNNQKLTLSYFGDRTDDVLYPRYRMDAQVDDTDMFNLKYQRNRLSNFSDELKIEAYHSKVTHVMGTDFRVAATNATTTMVAPVEATIQGLSIENTLTVLGTKISVGLDGSVRNWNGTSGAKINPATRILLPDVDTKNIALYAKALKTIGNYDLSGGIRYDDTSINADQALMPTATDQEHNSVSANLLGKYHYSQTGNVFMGVGQSVRVPDAKELYWPTLAGSHDRLNKTKNREIDAGAEHTVGNIHIKGTAFYSDLKDSIYAYKSGANLSWKNMDARIVGFDLKTDIALNNEWRIDAGMAYQKGTKKDPSQLGQTDKDLAEIPPMKGRAALVFENTAHYAAAEWIGASNQTIDSDNGEKEIGGYGIVNVKYGAQLGNDFSLTTGINNFFNRTYAVSNSYVGNEFIADGGVPLVLNEPGRNFYATLGYKF
ncbi:MAG: iron complex outerrane recepter protein [Campylobacterota bacterium]|nr:iron complex outerrane recepter protein [Campylobacterota bacterium]